MTDSLQIWFRKTEPEFISIPCSKSLGNFQEKEAANQIFSPLIKTNKQEQCGLTSYKTHKRI